MESSGYFMATQRHAPILAGITAALSTATAFGLTRVFEHNSWLFAVGASAMLASGVVWACLRFELSTPVSMGALCTIGFWWSNVVVRPHELWLGLPSFTAIGNWFEAVGQSGTVLRSAIVPVPPQGPALQLAIVVVFAVACGSTWSAAKPDGALSSLIAQFALFIAIAALGKGAYTTSAVVWLLTVFGFLLLHHTVHSTEGQTGFHTTTPRRSRLVAGGAIGAAVAVFSAALIGPQLPSASSPGLLKYRNFGSNDGPSVIRTISPLVSIRDQLNQNDDTELFTVESSRPARWRLMALEAYDGDEWGLHPDTESHDSLPESLHQPNAQIARVSQRYAMGPYGGEWLPAAFEPIEIGAVPGLKVIHESKTLIVNRQDHTGLSYDVTSELVGAAPATLRAAPAQIDTEQPGVERNLLIPKNLPPIIEQTALHVTRDKVTQYDKALAIQNYFRDNFEYDTSINLSDNDDATVRFLTKERRGFCQQFASTFGLMARSLGMPTRIAVGFQPGTFDGKVYRVGTKDAHAWPEMYFEGVGWIGFEPTPSRFDRETPGDPSGTKLGQTAGPNQPNAPATTTPRAPSSTTATSEGSTPTTKLRPLDRIETAGVQDTKPKGTSLARRSAFVAGFVFASLLLLFAGWRIPRRVRLHRRRSRGTARTRITQAWAYANERLALFNIHRRPSTTVVEFALREAPAAGVGAAGGALVELAQLHNEAMYAPFEPAEADAEDAWDCADRIDAAMRELITNKRRRWLIRLRW